MADYPYCTVPGKLSEFLGKIQGLGIPDKVTTKWLPTIGFSSKNDRSIIPVLKHVGLVSSDGTPTQVWVDFRGAASGRALGRAVVASYDQLFKTYPDAPNRTTDELQAFFRGHSSYGAQAVGKAVATFKALCQHAEFDEADVEGSPKPPPSSAKEAGNASEQPRTPIVPPQATSGSPSLHIDIQIHISPEASPDQIEKIFESMSKHLYKNK